MRRSDGVRDPDLPPALTPWLGGPRGTRQRPAGNPLAGLAPVVLLLAVPLSLAALRQAGCLADGWRGGTPVWRQCSSPLVELVRDAGLGRGLTAYLSGEVRLDEPVGSGAVTTLLAWLAPGGGTGQQRWFLVLWMVLVALVLAGLVVAVGTMRRHPRADPVVLALSPVLALTVLLSADLVPVALAVAAVWAWTRDRSRLAGALGGLAALAGPMAVLVLLAMAVLPGPQGRVAVRRLLGSALLTVVAVAVPVALLDAGTLTRPFTAWLDGGAGPGSPWYLLTLAGHPMAAGYVAAIAGLGMVVGATLVVLSARARPAPVVAAAALVGLVAVLVSGAGFAPASAIWLVPFVAMVGIGWRDHLIWAGAEVVHAVALFGYLLSRTDPSHGLPAGWYALALLLRTGAVAWIGVQAWLSASWGDAVPAGTLWRLPSARPVENSTGGVGSNAYPPVTERP